MINIEGTSSSNGTCTITYDYPQTAYRTYSNGTFTVNEDGSTGHYDSEQFWATWSNGQITLSLDLPQK